MTDSGRTAWGFECPGCLSKDAGASILHHDADGTMTLLCFACEHVWGESPLRWPD